MKEENSNTQEPAEHARKTLTLNSRNIILITIIVVIIAAFHTLTQPSNVYETIPGPAPAIKLEHDPALGAYHYSTIKGQPIPVWETLMSGKDKMIKEEWKVGTPQSSQEYDQEVQKALNEMDNSKIIAGQVAEKLANPESTKTVQETALTIDTSEVGGPSAGMLFALAAYDSKIDEDLTQGKIITGTGTIEENGTIGIVGGIKHKLQSAQNINADIFFIPKAEYDQEYSKQGWTFKIVPVENIQDAIKYLEHM